MRPLDLVYATTTTSMDRKQDIFRFFSAQRPFPCECQNQMCDSDEWHRCWEEEGRIVVNECSLGRRSKICVKVYQNIQPPKHSRLQQQWYAHLPGTDGTRSFFCKMSEWQRSYGNSATAGKRSGVTTMGCFVNMWFTVGFSSSFTFDRCIIVFFWII